jgi:hypothetical protein
MRYYTSIDEQVVPSQFPEYEWLQYNRYEESRDTEIPDTTGKWMIFSKTQQKQIFCGLILKMLFIMNKRTWVYQEVSMSLQKMYTWK